MSIYIGDKEIKDLCIGDGSAKEVYLGENKVRPSEPSYEPGQFCKLGNEILSVDYTVEYEGGETESGTVYPVDVGYTELYNNIFHQYCSEGDAELPSGVMLYDFMSGVLEYIFNDLGEDSSYSQVEIVGISSSGSFNLPAYYHTSSLSTVLNTQYNFSDFSNDVKYYLLSIIIDDSHFELSDCIKLNYNDDSKKLTSDNPQLSGVEQTYLMLITLSQP